MGTIVLQDEYLEFLYGLAQGVGCTYAYYGTMGSRFSDGQYIGENIRRMTQPSYVVSTEDKHERRILELEKQVADLKELIELQNLATNEKYGTY